MGLKSLFKSYITTQKKTWKQIFDAAIGLNVTRKDLNPEQHHFLRTIVILNSNQTTPKPF